MNRAINSPFNSPLEVGLRSATILLHMYPNSVDLQTLVELDYLVLHSADAGGPESLHTPLPYRSGELLVRRGVIESGLMLFIGRGLIERVISSTGFEFLASDSTFPFINSLNSKYIKKLQERADWATSQFNNSEKIDFKKLTKIAASNWSSQFQTMENIKDDIG